MLLVMLSSEDRYAGVTLDGLFPCRCCGALVGLQQGDGGFAASGPCTEECYVYSILNSRQSAVERAHVESVVQKRN